MNCVEVCCWPKGKAERRYAGVTHINVDEVDEAKASYIKGYCAQRGIEISALAYYPNTMDPDLEKRAVYIEHIKKLIKAAKLLGVGTVNTFVGRDPIRMWMRTLKFSRKYGRLSLHLQRNMASGSALKTARCCSPTTNGPADRT